jgi:hypothetical protein
MPKKKFNFFWKTVFLRVYRGKKTGLKTKGVVKTTPLKTYTLTLLRSLYLGPFALQTVTFFFNGLC